MKKFLTALTTILLFSQFSGAVFAFENKVTENDIKRACAIISSSRNYESSLRLRTLHELDEKAGKEYTTSLIEQWIMADIKLRTMSGGTFEYNCRKKFIESYMK